VLRDAAYAAIGTAADRHGNFYGVTNGGGANGTGTVFELAANGTEYGHRPWCSMGMGYYSLSVGDSILDVPCRKVYILGIVT
jgi:uncharacterized repeat protein (TIGR03803 family)